MLIYTVSDDACQWNGHDVVISICGIFFYRTLCMLHDEEKLSIQWLCSSDFRRFARVFLFVVNTLTVFLSFCYIYKDFVRQLKAFPPSFCLKHTTLMGTQTFTRQLVLDEHNKSQSYHGLLKLHLVSKLNLRKRKTKSLSGWKLKSCRSSENLTIRPETLTKALQIITHMVCFTTFSQPKIWWFETKLLLLLSQFLYT